MTTDEPPDGDLQEAKLEAAPGIASYAAEFAGPGVENLRRYVALFPAAGIGAPQAPPLDSSARFRWRPVP